MKTLIRILGVMLLAMLLGEQASAQEWTRFRGPNGSGENEATTIPAEFSDKDFNWKIELPGKGNSSPVVWGVSRCRTSWARSEPSWLAR